MVGFIKAIFRGYKIERSDFGVALLIFVYMLMLVAVFAYDSIYLKKRMMEEVPVLGQSENQYTSQFKGDDNVLSQFKMIQKIEQEIDDVFIPLAEQGATYSLKTMSLEENIYYYNVGNCLSRMVSASLIKLYVATTVYGQIDEVKAFETYEGETEELLRDMISLSSNDACNTLVERLGEGDAIRGMRKVNRFCLAHGFYQTEMNRLMLDFNGLENYTSTTDCCNLLAMFYRNQLPGSANIIDFMKGQAVRTKIPAGITDGAIVANKTGELTDTENDVAIVFTDSGAYILCVMTNNLQDTTLARNTIAQAAIKTNFFINQSFHKESFDKDTMNMDRYQDDETERDLTDGKVEE